MLYHEVKKYITSSIMLEMFFVDIIDPRGWSFSVVGRFSRPVFFNFWVVWCFFIFWKLSSVILNQF
jgi:hypothetical protein